MASAPVGVGVYESPSCVSETFMSLWIWVRERMDVELVNTRTAMIAESNLVSVRDNIDKNKQKTVAEQDVLLKDIRAKAKACKGGSKEQRMLKLKSLLPHMQRFKRGRQQTALASQQLSLLDAQINAFESGRFQRVMTDTLKASVVAMKKVGIKEDDMDTVVMDIEDTIQQQNEISDSLNMTVVNSMDEGGTSDDSLMRELMALAGDDDDEDEDHVPPYMVTQRIPAGSGGAVAGTTTSTTTTTTLPPATATAKAPISISMSKQALAPLDEYSEYSEYGGFAESREEEPSAAAPAPE